MALVVVCVAVLCDSEIAKERVAADGVDIEDETVTDTSDDDETEGRTVIEFGFKSRDAVALALLCNSEIAKELVVDGGVDIEVETSPDTSGDDEAEGRKLVKFDVTPSDAVALVVVCDREIVTDLVADGVDIEDETFAETSDEDETEGRILVEFGFKPRDAVALALLCDSERAKDLVVDGGVDIEYEAFTDTSGDDETEGGILVEFGFKTRDAVAFAVVCDSELVTKRIRDGLDIEETLVNTSNDDETEGGTLKESDVTRLNAVALAVLCDSEIATESVADCFDIEDEAFADTLDDDETEEFGVTLRNAVVLEVLCDCETHTQLVADCFNSEEETFADT